MIGDIAPKKIEAPLVASTSVVGSSWNAAGTFESRDLTTWAHHRLKAVLTGVNFNVESCPNCKFETLSISSVDGDAQFIAARGKSKHVCDLSLELTYRIRDEATSAVTESKVRLSDITADGEFEIDWDRVVGGPSCLSSAQSQAVKTFKTYLNDFVDEFLSK